MNDYPGKPEDSFDPSAFDADAFLGDSLDMADEFDTFLKDMEAETIAAEKTVMDALEKVGFPVSPIRTSQAKFAPEEPLAASIEKLIPMRERFQQAGKIRDAIVVHNIIVLSFAIQDVAGQKHTSDMLDNDGDIQSFAKKEQQASIYANSQLLPEHKEFFLAAIDELYPDADGLEPGSPDTAVSIQEYDQEQAVQMEVTEKAHALRELADIALRNALVELGLGQHDQLDDVASTIVVTLTRMHVVETGNYSDERREAEAIATRSSGIHDKTQAMGWSEDQLELVLDVFVLV
jgi:hypothetical protein